MKGLNVLLVTCISGLNVFEEYTPQGKHDCLDLLKTPYFFSFLFFVKYLEQVIIKLAIILQ